MKVNLIEHLQQLHPLVAYHIDDIVSCLPWGHFRMIRILRGMLGELLASFPNVPDEEPGRYLGCRWLSATAEKPLPLKEPRIDISTHALGQALLKSSPQVAAKFFLLACIEVKGSLIPTLVTGVAMWRPALCTRP